MTFTDLPPELLLMISDLLPLVDVVCFSLCSHSLFSLLGKKGRILLKPKSDKVWPEAVMPNRNPLVWNEDRELFLTRLSRDQLRYFFCFYCAYLHPWEKIQPPGPAFRPNTPLQCQTKNTAYTLSIPSMAPYYRVSYSHVQLAMRRFYHGPDYGISTKSLSYTEVLLEPYKPITALLSVEARICRESPSLCMRIQHLVSVHRRSGLNLLLAEISWLAVCAHTYMGKPGGTLPMLVKGLTDAYRGGNDTPAHVYRCHWCSTDYTLALREYDRNKLGLVLTKWLDFGSGLSAADPQWNSQFGTFRDTRPGVVVRVGDTRVRFENAPGEGSEEDLTRRNISYLSGNRYKVDIDKMNMLRWFL